MMPLTPTPLPGLTPLAIGKPRGQQRLRPIGRHGGRHWLCSPPWRRAWQREGTRSGSQRIASGSQPWGREDLSTGQS